jgi:hypothetical protein
MDQFIQVYEKAFSDEFCQKAIDYYNLAEQVGMLLNRQDHDNALKIEKQDTAAYLPNFPLHHTDKELMNEFNRVFWGHCYKQYAEQFDILKTCSEHKSYTMKIQKTQPGQGYHMWHAEATSKEASNRLLTWTVYLNDEFEAGETEFLYQHYRYKPQKGDCIIFPAAYTHTHRGNPPIGGDKYIITGWIEF